MSYKGPIHWNVKRNIKDLRDKLWNKKYQYKKDEYPNVENKYIGAVMKNKSHKYTKAQNIIFRTKAKKLHLRAQIKDKKFANIIQNCKNPFFRNNFENSKCPLGCNTDETLEHLLECNKNHETPKKSFQKVTKVLKKDGRINSPIKLNIHTLIQIANTGTCEEVEEKIKRVKSATKKKIKTKLVIITNEYIHLKWAERHKKWYKERKRRQKEQMGKNTIIQ